MQVKKFLLESCLVLKEFCWLNPSKEFATLARCWDTLNWISFKMLLFAFVTMNDRNSYGVLTLTHWSPQTACVRLWISIGGTFSAVKNSIKATLFELNVWKLFHFEVQWVRTVSICVFKVKYDGSEIPCDYTEPVLSRYV